MHSPTDIPPTLNDPAPAVRVAQVVPCTEAEGPGKRFALWFQGCPLRCPGCCNPEFLSFNGGVSKPLAELIADIEASHADNGIEGITLLGGEPFAHAGAATTLARAARSRGLSIMIFSGYTLEQLRALPDPAVGELIDLTDILVDGPYLRDQTDTDRRWVGSTNQHIHFLSSRYEYDKRWRRRNTLEIRMSGGEISVNGFPANDAVSLWKGWKRKKSPAVPSAREQTGADPK